MKAIAVVVARGGSKRIPRKNIREFAGKPIIDWPIQTALQSGLFGEVIVSTDDREIAEVSIQAGAKVPFIRPAELAGDQTGTIEVLSHAVLWAQNQGWSFQSACCLYGTAALTQAGDLQTALELLSEGEWDYVFAAGRYLRPPQRAFLRTQSGAMSLLLPEFALVRSQDLETAHFDAGQFYWGSASAWAEQRPIFGKRTSFIDLPAARAVDIDTPEDWTMAERQFSEWKQGRHE